MSESSSNNKRIAKNTLLLYFRMLLTMAVTLYTSRIVLKVLGVEDYGIYNVVGGVVTMLGFINSSLSGAGSRYLTYELGKENQGNMKQMFSTILFMHFFLAIIIVAISETVGLWFVHNKLVIPEERMVAALWAYHCSILTSAVSIVSVPYNSLIIAHEKMGVFAYISIIEVSLKLLIVFFLANLSYDKLIVYAILYLAVQILIRIIYNHYCTKHFQESRTLPAYHPKQMREIFTYATWTLNGNLAVAGYTQGLNILLNMFFGPMVNAARGIAVQVQSAIMTFVQNFQVAINPQIIKSYAANEFEYMHSLIIASSKYGVFLMMIVAFPVFLFIHSILQLWLGVIPDYTPQFIQIMLFVGLLRPLCSALITGIHATGDIRKFQLYEGTSLLMVVPVSYLLLKFCQISPIAVMVTYLCIEIITQSIRIWIVLPKINMRYGDYIRDVIKPLILPLSIMFLGLFCIKVPYDLSFGKLCVYAITSCICMTLCVFVFGLNKKERSFLFQYIRKKKIQS